MSSISRLLQIGAPLAAAGVLNTLDTRLQTLLIARIYGAYDVGQYMRASSTQGLPAGLLVGVLSKVALPAMARLQNQPDRLREGLRDAVRLTAAATAPAMMGLCATADRVVFVLFGEAWSPCAPILQILCIAGLFLPLHVLNVTVILATGQTAYFLKLEAYKRMISIAILIATIPFGLIAIAYGQFGASVICFFFNVRCTHSRLQYGARDQLRDCLPWWAASAAMAIVVYVFGSVISGLAVALVLGCQVIGGVALMLMAVAALEPKFISKLRDILNGTSRANP